MFSLVNENDPPWIDDAVPHEGEKEADDDRPKAFFFERMSQVAITRVFLVGVQGFAEAVPFVQFEWPALR